ncbi:HAD family hydrolase [Bacillus sp. Marseille-P3661]|uniref:HAD family hydrolase n=1 Tax=Bacillus sp. Marseille-P3661 TaxID=1936234 RepID=UPI000C862B19|nr:HAD family hydrolase [Bacillus sp. Marseille-P3661]
MNWGCICFDLDNTLLNYEKAFKEGMYFTFKHFFYGESSKLDKVIDHREWFIIFKKLCDELWKEVETKRWTKQKYREKRFILSLNHFGVNTDSDKAEEFQAYFYANVHQFVEPFEGVYSFIEELKKRKIPLGIITNGDAALQNRKLHKIGLSHLFHKEQIFISSECGSAKPQQHIFNIAHQRLNSSSAPSLYIGDSWELDIVGAMNAGWDTIYFNTRNKQPSTSHQPIGECLSISEVKDLLFT